MIVEAAIVSGAVELVKPYLGKVAKGLVDKVTDESLAAGSKLVAWMKEKLTGRAREALDDLETAPESEDNAADLRKQLAKELAARPDLAEEFVKLVGSEPRIAQAMSQVVSGAGAKAIQNQGENNQNWIG